MWVSVMNGEILSVKTRVHFYLWLPYHWILLKTQSLDVMDFFWLFEWNGALCSVVGQSFFFIGVMFSVPTTILFYSILYSIVSLLFRIVDNTQTIKYPTKVQQIISISDKKLRRKNKSRWKEETVDIYRTGSGRTRYFIPCPDYGDTPVFLTPDS